MDTGTNNYSVIAEKRHSRGPKSEPKALLESNLNSFSKGDYSPAQTHRGTATLKKRGVKDELWLVQRRLVFAQDDIKRLSGDLASARSELKKKEQESSNHLSRLERELATLRSSLKSRERELENSRLVRNQLEEKLKKRNDKCVEFAQRFKRNQTKLKTMDKVLRDFEKERQETLSTLPAVGGQFGCSFEPGLTKRLFPFAEDTEAHPLPATDRKSISC